ncbi:UBX domain-containing protein 4 [Monosporozyma servazzii]
MSSVNVNYKFQTYKVKVTPSTNLNDVLKQSVSHFKLDQDSIDILSAWTFLHKDKSVEMDLPWRLLNLPAGCNLDLISILNESESDKNKSNSSADDLIKIRFQVAGHGSVIQQVNPTISVLETLNQISQEQQWEELSQEETLQNIKLRVLSSVYEYEQIKGKTFQDLGITKSISINIEVGATPIPSIIPSKERTADLMDIDMVTESDSPHELHKPTVYLPSSDKISIDNITEDDDDTYELSVEQAKRYQNILLKQTGNLGGPIMTRRMREEKLKTETENNRKRITECLVRVKFPDRTYLEIAFKPEETMSNVYQLVSENLSYDNLKFQLYQPHPHVLLESNEKSLADDLKFGLKNVILLEPEDSTKKGPFLKDSVLKYAKPIIETLEYDRQPSTKEKKIENPTKHEQPVSQERKTKKSLNGVPKWLRLSKK